MKGRLIVVEGADASGKHTQAGLLLKRLRKQGHKAELVAFPRYGSFFGKLVRRFLRGSFGKVEAFPPEFPAMLNALDRLDALPLLEKKLKSGKLLLADRFTASNIAYQGARLSGRKQKSFIKWLTALESPLPQPVLIIYLDVPVSFSQRLMSSEGRKRDLYERDPSYLKRVRSLYLQLAKQPRWSKVQCVRQGQLLPIAEIHEAVWKKAKKYI